MDYSYWKTYFESNKSHFSDIHAGEEDALTGDERKLIRSSLQQFQKGEYSEGKHLFAYAKSFPDPDYLSCIRLFICEEQMHAKVLGCFMDRYSIPQIRGHWVDSVFRRLRKLAGIENSISVLLVAEIISKIYYVALQKATGSFYLRKICAQILKDEDQHIAFQCHTLRIFYNKKSLGGKFLSRTIQFLLMNGTTAVVWWYHQKVLRKGGFSARLFRKAVLEVYFDCEAVIASRRMYKDYPEILLP